MALIVDVHTHPLLPIWKSAIATATGQSIDNLAMYGVPMPGWSIEAHLAAMDANGVTAAVLSLPGVASLATGAEARSLSRAINEAFAEIIDRHPGRFGAFAVLPLDDIDAALEEVAYALDTLGLDGVGIGTTFAGQYLGDAYFEPLFEALDERGAVLFAHPGPPPGYKPKGGIDVSILEFMFESTRMVTNLILSGAKQRYPAVKVISTHGGGAIPYLASRISILEPLFGAGAGRRTLSAGEVMAGLQTFHFDLTASCAAASLDAIRRLVPPRQLLFGTDFPMMPKGEIAPALDRLASYEGLGAEEKLGILSTNALHLLPRLSGRLRSRPEPVATS